MGEPNVDHNLGQLRSYTPASIDDLNIDDKAIVCESAAHVQQQEPQNQRWAQVPHGQRIPCKSLGCVESFTRPSDLTRHHNTIHAPHDTKQKFWCPIRGCKRGPSQTPRRPFPRKDKRDDHVRKVHRCEAPREGAQTLASTTPSSFTWLPDDVGETPGGNPDLPSQGPDVLLIPAQPELSCGPNGSIAALVYDCGAIEEQHTAMSWDLSGPSVNSGPYLNGDGFDLTHSHPITSDTTNIIGYHEPIDPSMSVPLTDDLPGHFFLGQTFLPNGQGLAQDQMSPPTDQYTLPPHGGSTVHVDAKSIGVSNYGAVIDTIGLTFANPFQNFGQVDKSVQGYTSPSVGGISAWNNTIEANSGGHNVAQLADDFEDMIDWEGPSVDNAYV